MGNGQALRAFTLLALFVTGCGPSATPPTPTAADVASPASPVAAAPAATLPAEPYPAATALPPSDAAYPGPAPTATPDALQLTQAAAVETILAGWPTTAPSPTFPAGTRACQAGDLDLWARSGGATASIVLAVIITNTAPTTCYLQGPPDLKLVDANGSKLEIEYAQGCFLCSEPRPPQTAVPAATQTAVAQAILYDRIALAPNAQAGVTLIWMNWCQPSLPGGVKLRLALPDGLGVIEGDTDANAGGRCEVPEGPSHLMVSHYFRQP